MPIRYIPQTTNPLNLQDFGAFADSTTDIKTAIQKAHDYLPTNGGALYLPYGIYVMSSGVTFTKPITFFGDGTGATQIFKTDATGDLFTMNGLYQHLQSLSIVNGPAQTAGSFVKYGSSAQRQWLEEVSMFGAFRGVLWTGISSFRMRDCLLLVGVAATGIGVYIQNGISTDMRFTNITIDNQVGSEIGNGFQFDVLGDAVLEGCSVIHCINGLAATPPAGAQVSSLWATNSFFDNCTQRGVVLQPQAATGIITRVRFADCWTSSTIGANATGFLINANGGSIDGVEVVNLHAFGNTQEGLQVTGGAPSGNINTFVTGGMFAGNGRDGIRFGSAGSGTTKFAARGVMSGQCGGFGVNTGFGINVTNAACTNYILLGNDTQGNTAGGIQDLGVAPKVVASNL